MLMLLLLELEIVMVEEEVEDMRVQDSLEVVEHGLVVYAVDELY